MATYTEESQCGSCGAPIYWLKHHRTKKPAPIDVKPNPEGNILLDITHENYCNANPMEKISYRQWLHTNHFQTCPQAKAWKKAGRH